MMVSFQLTLTIPLGKCNNGQLEGQGVNQKNMTSLIEIVLTTRDKKFAEKMAVNPNIMIAELVEKTAQLLQKSPRYVQLYSDVLWPVKDFSTISENKSDTLVFDPATNSLMIPMPTLLRSEKSLVDYKITTDSIIYVNTGSMICKFEERYRAWHERKKIMVNICNLIVHYEEKFYPLCEWSVEPTTKVSELMAIMRELNMLRRNHDIVDFPHHFDKALGHCGVYDGYVFRVREILRGGMFHHTSGRDGGFEGTDIKVVTVKIADMNKMMKISVPTNVFMGNLKQSLVKLCK